MDELQALCKQLLLSGVSLKSIYDSIRQIYTAESSAMPKTKIIHNVSYGEFALTDHFTSYIYKPTHSSTSEIETYAERIHPVAFLECYGVSLSKVYTIVACLIHNYIQYDLGRVFQLVNQLHNTEKHLHQLYLHKQSLLNAADTELSTCDDVPLSGKSLLSQIDIKQFSRNAIDHMIHKSIPAYEALLASESSDCLEELQEFPIDLIHEMKRSITVHQHSQPSLSFKDAVDKQGELDPTIWNFTHQRYNYHAMSFLTAKCPSMVSICSDLLYSKTFDTIHAKLYAEIALTFAADKCKLSVVEVPSLLNWEIKNENGIEEIRFV